MDIIALQRYVRISPKKMRPVADVARNMIPTEAVEKLPFLRKKGSEVLIKVIKSAIDNAKQKGISDSDIIFKEIQISEGPRLKRGRAASRGRWHPYKKRMSHVRVVLTTMKPEVKNQKSEAKEKGDEKSDIKKSKEKEEDVKVVGNKATLSKTAGSVGKAIKFAISKKGGKTL